MYIRGMSSLPASGLRKLLNDALRTESDLETFCLDYFPAVKQKMGSGMERVAKVTLLFECVDAEAIASALVDLYPKLGEKLAPLRGDNPAPASAAPAANPPTPAAAPAIRWDFFLAHAAADLPVAMQIYTALSQASCRVFLDAECLLPGDDWTLALPRAQREARVTVVLVSARCDRAYYQREEIAAAIALSRDERYRHRVVPVYLDGSPISPDAIPYGLRVLQGIETSKAGGLIGVYVKLARLHCQLVADTGHH